MTRATAICHYGQMLRIASAVLALLVASPALAGGYVTLTCSDGSLQRQFMVGTGRQIKGQGLELWPMMCTSTGKFSTYSRVMDADRFARLSKLAARPVRDSVEVKSVLGLSAELGDTGLTSLFDQAEGLTFGDIRSTVANTARDTGRHIGNTHHTAWTHSTCSGDLIPFDYYLDTGAPCPACGGGKLTVNTDNRAEWE